MTRSSLVYVKPYKVGRTRMEKRLARTIQTLEKLAEERDIWAADLHRAHAAQPEYTPAELLTIHRLIMAIDALQIDGICDSLIEFLDNTNLPAPPVALAVRRYIEDEGAVA